jgi:hypothetical protein
MIQRTLLLLIVSLFTFAISLPLNSEAQSAGAGSKTSTPIQTQETEMAGVVAELMEVKRKDGVLTVKVNFRNTGDAGVKVYIETEHGKYEHIYVTANTKKYFVLKDSEGAPLAPKYIEGNPEKGQKVIWWAKFPAPPADVKKINLIIPKMPPFEDVPITD